MNTSQHREVKLLTCVGVCFISVLSLASIVHGSDYSSAEDGNYFVVDDLKYRVLNNYGGTHTVAVAGLSVDNLNRELSIPSTVDYDNISYAVTQIDDRAFYKMTSYTGDIVIPASIIKIGSFAFGDMQGPNGTIYIPSETTKIGQMAFSGCSGERFEVQSSNPNYSSVNGILYSKDITESIACPTGYTGSIVLPDTLEVIGDYSFYGCSYITAVEFPPSLKTIEPAAFENSGISGRLKLNEGLEVIDEGAFSDCINIEGYLEIPSTVSTVNAWAFKGCTAITSIKLSSGLNTLAESVFMRCTGLRGTITIPSSVVTVQNNLFCGCTGIMSVIMEEGITAVNLGAFANCTNLTSITFPSTITSLTNLSTMGLYVDDEPVMTASDVRGSTFTGSFFHLVKEVATPTEDDGGKTDSNRMTTIILAIVCVIILVLVAGLFLRNSHKVQ